MALQYFCFGCSKKHSSSSKRPYPTTLIEESIMPICHHFSLPDLRKATNNFHENNLIGRGGHGKVYRGCLQLDHVATEVAVRVMWSHVVGIQLNVFKNEIELLCQLRHPNLISLIGFCVHKDEKIIVYEYMSNGSLADRLFKSDARGPLSWKKRLEICIGVAHGLRYLHPGLKRTIIHRNITPANILLDDNMVPKLSDLGKSVQGAMFTEKTKPIQVRAKEILTGLSGPLDYISPEYICQGTVTDQYDVYSFGIVLLEVVFGKPVDALRNEFQQPPNEEIEMSNNGSESSLDDDHISMSWDSYIMLRLRAEDIDPALVGNIAPQCYAAYTSISLTGA